jgi:hypothetical protein
VRSKKSRGDRRYFTGTVCYDQKRLTLNHNHDHSPQTLYPNSERIAGTATEATLKAKYKKLDKFCQENGIQASKWKEAVERMNQAAAAV